MRELLEHLNAAYNLAKWLTQQDEQDSEDIVQDVYLRAKCQPADFYTGGGKASLLAIMRKRCYEELPYDLREVLVLRELEELSYKEIASIANLPLSTIMSRLSLARTIVRQKLTGLATRH